MEKFNKVRVKKEPICTDSQSIISQTSRAKKVKEEPIEIVKAEEEKFCATKEFANKASIAFLNEEITLETNQAKK